MFDRVLGDVEVHPTVRDENQLGRRLHLWVGSNENFAVLAAVAAFPKIDPKLTLVLARLVLGRPPDEDLITLLARLPWLRDGRMPNWLRITVFNRLPESMQKMVSARILSMLDTARRQEDKGVFWRALEERIAVLDVALPKEQLLGNLPSDTLDPSNALGEHVFLSFMRGERLDPVANALEPPAPEAIKRALGRQFDRRGTLLIVAFALLAIGIFAFQPSLSAVLIIVWQKTWTWLRLWLPLPGSTTLYIWLIPISALAALALGRNAVYSFVRANRVAPASAASRRSSIALGLAFFGLALFTYWAGRDLQGMRGFALGPGSFPRGLVVILMALSVLVMFERTVPSRINLEIGWRPLVLILLSGALFAFTLQPLGMLAAVGLVVMTTSIAAGMARALALPVILIVTYTLLFTASLLFNIPISWFPSL